MEKWKLTGKRTLITGASKGIGFAAALEMAALGAEVCLVARDKTELDAAVSGMAEGGAACWGIAADTTSPEDQERLREAVAERWGCLDILVNNVGTNIRKHFTEYTAEEYRKVFETNLFSTIALTRLFFPLLRQASRASVINVASVAGMVDVHSGAPYGMTKAAMLQMTRHLAVEWAPFGIRVNAVSPWYTRTPLAMPVLQQADRLQRILENTPLGRVAEAEEVAATIAFLAMDSASYVTGHNLVVDGGMTAQGMHIPMALKDQGQR
jgi:NAD(P)-dependent dehydrogenase (short-subunit alcohol dehydrogenase family)